VGKREGKREGAPTRVPKIYESIIFLYVMVREGYNWAFNFKPMYSEK
jgi:hypothetical protein